MQICFLSDSKALNFHPLTLTRPIDDLRIGVFTIREKWQISLGTEHLSRIVPDYLSEIFPPGTISDSEDCLWINPRYLPTDSLVAHIKNLDLNSSITYKDETVAALLSAKKSKEFHQKQQFVADDLQAVPVDEAVFIENYWDLIELNESEIINDIPRTGIKAVCEPLDDIDFICKNHKNIYIDDDVTIEPGVVIDASNGPVVVQKGATLDIGCILKGPVAICEGATVKMQARVSDSSTVGPVCKVAGEVSSCIFHSYSNKAHDGYAGNSIFGQWVNLGANTITSNLKNDYSTIKVTDWTTGERLDSGKQFLGTIMGDHSKTAINTSLNTGTVCGVCSNIFVNGLTVTLIPSFSWMGNGNTQPFRFDKAILVMRAMMKRRNIELTPEYEKMMKHIADNR